MKPRTSIHSPLRRRDFVALGAAPLLAATAHAAAPAQVSIGACRSYGTETETALRTMFDQLGGLGPLVSGKTVAVKIDMSGPLRVRTGLRPAWFTHWTHPAVIGSVTRLLGQAGAKSIVIVESSTENDHPLEENFLLGGWDPELILKAAPHVSMENTGALGRGKNYARKQVPGGGLIYPAFDFNPTFGACEVVISLAKMKQSPETGIALSMKNMLNVVPGTIYGDAAGGEAPALKPFGELGMFRKGNRQPAAGSPPERDPASPREAGHRLPRIVVDILRACPVRLAVIDGIETQTLLETAPEDGSAPQPKLVKPGLLVAGLSTVSTDAVATALMGFDPLARRGSAPFSHCDNMLELGAAAGLGARDPKAIQTAGLNLDAARFPFR